MPILDARHDFAHPVEGDAAWSESYYLNAYCPVVDAGLFTRIGVRPNEGTIDVSLAVWLPSGELADFHATREQHEMTDSDLAVGGVRYERIAPMQSWRLTADVDRVALDLTFDALTPTVGVDGQGRTATSIAAGCGPTGRTRASGNGR